MADEAAARAGSRAGTLQSAPLRLIELGIEALRVLYPQRISREFDDPAVGKYREGGVRRNISAITYMGSPVSRCPCHFGRLRGRGSTMAVQTDEQRV